MFREVKDDDERRRRYSEGFGRHLRSVNMTSTDGRNEPQPERNGKPENVVSIGWTQREATCGAGLVMKGSPVRVRASAPQKSPQTPGFRRLVDGEARR
jgi:hypothetical protein